MTDPQNASSPRRTADPVVRVLLGCAAVIAVCVAVVAVILLVVGWNVTRDAAPGRPVESFLLGDEARYWRFDVRADDAGLKALASRLEEVNESARADMVKGTFLEALPLPRRHVRLDELAPFTLEIASTGDAEPPSGWAARATFSHGVLRLRAALRFIRWAASHGRGGHETSDVDGITVTQIQGDRARGAADVRFAFATIGTRLLVAADGARVRRMLQATGSTSEPDRAFEDMHARVKLPGEDAWAFVASARVAGIEAPPVKAVASLDVDEHDALAFRVAVADAEARVAEHAFSGTPEACRAVVRALLPVLPEDAIEIDAGGATRADPGLSIFTGRVSGLSERIGGLVHRVNGLRLQMPSASPTPASPRP